MVHDVTAGGAMPAGRHGVRVTYQGTPRRRRLGTQGVIVGEWDRHVGRESLGRPVGRSATGHRFA